MITIIDYGSGNLRSVANAVNSLGYRTQITSNPDDVLKAEAIILPGVGAAADTMTQLKALGMDSAIQRYVAADRPFLGVCLGLQILLTSTEEGGEHQCLGIVPGRVLRLPQNLKIPHMGWNQVKQTIEHPIFEGIADEVNYYFVHSYYVEPEDKSLIAGETEYGIPICSILIRGNLVATQFHPEKSGRYGLKLYDNFIRNAIVAQTNNE
ncbi:imidazole glycerol phosphate synthase subunit HisH [Chloroflexota bacterium]